MPKVISLSINNLGTILKKRNYGISLFYENKFNLASCEMNNRIRQAYIGKEVCRDYFAW